MGGTMNIGRFAALLGPPGLGLRLAALCDERERPFYERGLQQAGAPNHHFFVWLRDLEDELIRAPGTTEVEEIIRADGDPHPGRRSCGNPHSTAGPDGSNCGASSPQDPLRPPPHRGARPPNRHRPPRRPHHEPVAPGGAAPCRPRRWFGKGPASTIGRELRRRISTLRNAESANATPATSRARSFAPAASVRQASERLPTESRSNSPVHTTTTAPRPPSAGAVHSGARCTAARGDCRSPDFAVPRETRRWVAAKGRQLICSARARMMPEGPRR